MAMVLREDIPSKFVFHADRGTPSASPQKHAVCKQIEVSQTVGGTGVCRDSDSQESIWSILKIKFNNRQRLPSALDYQGSVNYEHKVDQFQTAKPPEQPSMFC
ncbi:hypothetical protein CVS30_16615 [Arthrobacter psychrolactophilus]|uniref:Integrase catalytic domain-containing protein n=1 Tax=Arthrobacter psychrolactophilus TaxID=92442 RepID=A0A2V5IMA4_9MICC|nr:hypothetical protein CVS30_16615 [Arthrobacter psychrolactophilus]